MKHSVLLFFLLALPAWAAPPKLSIPAEVKPAGQYAIVRPETDATSISYVGLDGVEPIPSELMKDGRVFALDTRGLKAGRYRFAAIAAGATGEQTRVDFLLIIGNPPSPSPDPGPGPSPEPGPDDTKKAAHVWAIVIEESHDRTPQQGKVMYDRDVRSWLTAGGHRIDVEDQNQPVVQRTGQLKHAQEVGLPAVLVFDLDVFNANPAAPQQPLRKFKLPATAAEFRSQLTKAVK